MSIKKDTRVFYQQQKKMWYSGNLCIRMNKILYCENVAINNLDMFEIVVIEAVSFYMAEEKIFSVCFRITHKQLLCRQLSWKSRAERNSKHLNWSLDDFAHKAQINEQKKTQTNVLTYSKENRNCSHGGLINDWHSWCLAI